MRIQRVAVALMVALAVACTSGTAPGVTTTSAPLEYLGYSDRVDMVVECVRAKGYAAESAEGFGVMLHFDPSNEDVVLAAEGTCWEVEARYPLPPPLSNEELYCYHLEVAECLRTRGLDIPEAPTLETYLDEIEADGDTWRPFKFVFGADFWDLQRECGPDPWAR